MYKLAMGSFVGAPPASISVVVRPPIPEADHVVEDPLVSLGRSERVVVDENPRITLLRVRRQFQRMGLSSNDGVSFPFIRISTFPEGLSY